MVLDGLDESAGSSQKILEEAKRGRHLLLLTSRPYDVQEERAAANLQVAHNGVSNSQFQAYVRS